MKKLFFMVVGVLAFLFILNISASLAEDFNGPVSRWLEGTSPNAISDSNFTEEVYTSTAPGSGESYNKLATRVFSVGDRIYFNTFYYYAAASGRVTAYRFISNAAGSIKRTAVYAYDESRGYNFNWYSTNSLPAGVYYFNTVLLSTSGGWMISPDGYMFVVE